MFFVNNVVYLVYQALLVQRRCGKLVYEIFVVNIVSMTILTILTFLKVKDQDLLGGLLSYNGDGVGGIPRGGLCSEVDIV